MENPFKRSMIEIMDGAITRFQEEYPEIEVYWEENPEKRSTGEIAKILKTPDPNLIERLQKIERTIEQDIERLGIDENTPPYQTVIDLLKNGNLYTATGYIEVLLENSKLQIESAALGHSGMREYKGWEEEKILSDTTLIIESSIHPMMEDGPISAEDILQEALFYSDGNLNYALELSTSVLNYLTRDPEFLPNEPDRFLDQFSAYTTWHQLSPDEEPQDPRLMSPEKLYSQIFHREDVTYYDFSLPNQLGKPYHSFNLAFLLESYTPEIIATMTTGDYLLVGDREGMYKLLSDLDVLRDLYDIQDFLGQFKRKSE